MQFNSTTRQVKLLAVERRAMQRAHDACKTLGRLFDDTRSEAATKAAESLEFLLKSVEEPEPDLAGVV
jgi:hypothetical protein